MYVSNSNVPEDIDTNGNIYKMDLTGKLLGNFGHAGRLAKEFNAVNQLECRTENELWAAEIGNWRVSKSRCAATRARINKTGRLKPARLVSTGRVRLQADLNQ
jgi:hypothetical protein